MPILVATHREVVVIDVERGTSVSARGIGDRPTCLAADALVHGRAWCGTHRDGVVRTDDGGPVLAVSRSRRPADYGHRREPGRARRRLGGHGTGRSVAFGGRWYYVGADEPTGDIAVGLGMVVSAETGHASRSLDRVPPART
jgi:hypothetical protein